jgi:hypothetical protein
MKSMFARFVCRMLAASMIVLPFHAQAGLIGTDQAASPAQTRAALAAVIDRSEMAGQLQAFGLSPQEAKARVAALTDAEVAALAGRVDALPSGGFSGLLPILVVLILIWYLTASDKAQADAVKSAPKPKPAPAPEKK